MSGRLGGSVMPYPAGAPRASVLLDAAAMKRVVLRQPTELPPAETLLVSAERACDAVAERGFGDLAPLARELRHQLADLRAEVQHASEEIRRLHHAIREA